MEKDVKSHKLTIIFGKNKKKSVLELNAGSGPGEVSAIVLHQQPVHHKKIKLKRGPGVGKGALEDESSSVWKEVQGAIKHLEVTDETLPDNSGDALCFETPEGWFCIE